MDDLLDDDEEDVVVDDEKVTVEEKEVLVVEERVEVKDEEVVVDVADKEVVVDDEELVVDDEEVKLVDEEVIVRDVEVVVIDVKVVVRDVEVAVADEVVAVDENEVVVAVVNADNVTAPKVARAASNGHCRCTLGSRTAAVGSPVRVDAERSVGVDEGVTTAPSRRSPARRQLIPRVRLRRAPVFKPSSVSYHLFDHRVQPRTGPGG